MTIDPYLLADVMAAADHLADEISEHHPLNPADRVLLAQAVEDKAWEWLTANKAELTRLAAEAGMPGFVLDRRDQ